MIQKKVTQTKLSPNKVTPKVTETLSKRKRTGKSATPAKAPAQSAILKLGKLNILKGAASRTAEDWQREGQLRIEKCELKEAELAFRASLEIASEEKNLPVMMEAIASLLRLASEATNFESFKEWDQKLDQLIAKYPGQIPPLVWYCKGIIANYNEQFAQAQRFFHRCQRSVRARHQDPGSQSPPQSNEEIMAKAWLAIANTARHRNHNRRAKFLTELVLKHFGAKNIRGINGSAHLILGHFELEAKDLAGAMRHYQEAYGFFLAEHNWYHHLYVLLAYARLARLQQNYSQAYWHLDMIRKACTGPEFGILLREINRERARLEEDAVDLLIDSKRGVIKTRDGCHISLRKQYVLLHLLEALSLAHRSPGSESSRGLSKAEIIEQVWKEPYRPEAHDNKLYYNINRLRKLIEPNIKQPQYLLNWKEGYRLAPGLRIQWITEQRNGGEQK